MKNISTIYKVLVVAVILAVLTTLGLISAHNGNNSDAGKVKVVAGENFWGNITSQIGGNHVAVTSIISNPSTDPHLYESDAHNAAAISSANLVIENGLGYDDFIDKIMATSPNSNRQVLSVEKTLNITGSDPNPHLWYDIPRVPVVAAAIERALAAKDPANSATYAANLKTFDNSLQPIIAVIDQIKSKYPAAPVAYTERVPGYLLADAGLSVKSPAGFASAIEEGDDPSPADTAAMDGLMTDHGVKVLLYNAQATSAVTQHVRDLANQAGIPVIGVTETLPPADATYQAWQLAQANALLKALGG